MTGVYIMVGDRVRDVRVPGKVGTVIALLSPTLVRVRWEYATRCAKLNIEDVQVRFVTGV